MIIIQENKNEYEENFDFEECTIKLNEMAVQSISGDIDRLPFDISIKTPEKNKTFHAHIMKKGVKGVELGAFEITRIPPRSIKDLIGYTKGSHKGLKHISENEQQLIVNWAIKKNNLDIYRTNWESLSHQYALALRSY